MAIRSGELSLAMDRHIMVGVWSKGYYSIAHSVHTLKWGFKNDSGRDSENEGHNQRLIEDFFTALPTICDDLKA